MTRLIWLDVFRGPRGYRVVMGSTMTGKLPRFRGWCGFWANDEPFHVSRRVEVTDV